MSLSRATLSKYNPLFTSLEPSEKQINNTPKTSDWLAFAFSVMLIDLVYQALKFFLFKSIPVWQSDLIGACVLTISAAVIRWRLLLSQSRLLKCRYAAERDLSRERYILRTILDVLPEGIYVKDLQGRYCVINPRVVKFFKANSESDIIGKTDFDLYPKELADQIVADDQQVVQTRRPLFNREERIPAGEKTRWLLVTKVPLIDSNREVRGVVCMARDITARKFAEEQLQKAKELAEGRGRDLIAANEKLRYEQTERKKVESQR